MNRALKSEEKKKEFILIRWMRAAKDWTESFSEKPYALAALFIIALAESSFFPIPPDVLLIAIAVSAPRKSLKAALWCSIGSVFGGILGYYIGYGLWDSVGSHIVAFYGEEAAWANLSKTYSGEVGFWILAGAAFTPIPYKIATIAAGAVQMDLLYFILISSIGRSARFFLVGGLFYYIGPKAKPYIEKYFDKLAIAFLLLLIGGFLAIKFLI